MESTELAGNTGESATRICFETGPGTRLADKLYALVLASTLFLLAVFLPFGVALAIAEQAKLPLTPTVAVAVVVTLWSIRVCWKWVASRLPFCMVFHADYLQAGRALARCDFLYNDIEIVSLPQGRDEGCWIKVRCGGTIARVNLTPGQVSECVALLRYCCPNATLVDEEGREHFPENPTHVEQALMSAEEHYARKAWFWGMGGCFFACFLVGGSCTLIGWWRGNLQLDGFAVTRVIFLLACCAVLAYCGFLGAWKSWRTSRRIRDTRRGVPVSEDPP